MSRPAATATAERETAKVDFMHAKIFDLTHKRVYVAGHRGMVGSAIVRRLAKCQLRCDHCRPR